MTKKPKHSYKDVRINRLKEKACSAAVTIDVALLNELEDKAQRFDNIRDVSLDAQEQSDFAWGIINIVDICKRVREVKRYGG
tara:strand:+ start:43240 stop:43485 length:246 start_codon:yes stop_codon:yes gene_type:complete